MTRRGAVPFAMILLLALTVPAAAFEWPFGKSQTPPPAPPRPVVSEILSPPSVTEARSVPGVIAARTQVNLGFQTLGRLTERGVEIGDRVEQGQVLARLDPEDLTGNVRAAQAGLDAATVQLRTAEATAERVRALTRRNVASRAQLEQAEQALAAATAAAAQASSELLRAQDAEGFAEMTAPFAGVVSAVYENAGAVVEAGAPVVQISAEDEAEAVIDLPESALADLPPDPVLTVWQDSDQAGATNATIGRIDPLADSATRTRRLHLELEDASGFRLGALIRARLASDGNSRLTLPEAAIVMQDGAPHVWRVTRDGDGTGVVARVPVETGPVWQGRVPVSGAIAEGDEIVIRGVNSLDEGQQVGERQEP